MPCLAAAFDLANIEVVGLSFDIVDIGLALLSSHSGL
jgi:hypothetical protein